jgi:hypothetical protein
MTKDECKDECGDECSCGMSLEQVVQNNNVMVNVLAEILMDKKLVTEKEIKDKLQEIYSSVK